MTKIINLTGVGPVKIVKLRGSRRLTLSVDFEGRVRLTMPKWVPYIQALRFLDEKHEWLRAKVPNRTQYLESGMQIGKSHRMEFAACEATAVKARIVSNRITVSHPEGFDINSDSVQQAAKLAALRALKKEANALLPIRLNQLSDKTGLKFNNLSFKQMRRRWGSCSSDSNIALNIYLMQLPWHLIDYVLVHELTHTKVMNHGNDFWRELEAHLPGAKQLRKEIRTYHPTLLQKPA